MSIEEEITLADRTRFVLDPEAWARFMEMLERPPKEDPALRRLMTEPSVLEKGDFEG
jgi:uncharacterized protein (DUF1778 family)